MSFSKDTSYSRIRFQRSSRLRRANECVVYQILIPRARGFLKILQLESARYNRTVLRTQDTGPVTDKIIGRWRNKQRNKPLGAWAPGHYTKVGISDTMGSTKTTIEGNTDTMNCTIKPHHGHHRWNIDSRKDLERLWNANIHPKGGAFLSIRQFALSYGFPPSSLYEELTHGFVSKVLKDFNGRRFIYPEYSVEKAQKRTTHEAAQKGRRGKSYNQFS